LGWTPVSFVFCVDAIPFDRQHERTHESKQSALGER
jgi:hypothetical protein